VLVHSVPDSELKVGDVITYTNPLHPSTTITHRIVKIILIDGKIPGYITKGDANKLADVPIAAGAVEGKVVWHIPHIGYWLLDANKPIIILPIIYLAALIILLEEVKRLSDYFKANQPYRLSTYELLNKKSGHLAKKLGYAVSLSIAFIVVTLAISPTALALLKSNTVALVNNSITVAPNVGISTCTSTSNINVTNNSSQTSSSGNANSSGNTNGNSATSGNASNNSSTSTNISVSNC
jgi:hypothetical protein